MALIWDPPPHEEKQWMVDGMAFSFSPEENWNNRLPEGLLLCFLFYHCVDCEEMRNRLQVFEKPHRHILGLLFWLSQLILCYVPDTRCLWYVQLLDNDHMWSRLFCRMVWSSLVFNDVELCFRVMAAFPADWRLPCLFAAIIGLFSLLQERKIINSHCPQLGGRDILLCSF